MMMFFSNDGAVIKAYPFTVKVYKLSCPQQLKEWSILKRNWRILDKRIVKRLVKRLRYIDIFNKQNKWHSIFLKSC